MPLHTRVAAQREEKNGGERMDNTSEVRSDKDDKNSVSMTRHNLFYPHTHTILIEFEA
jgi:hypothetical protein